MNDKISRENRDIQLAGWMGYESGLGERIEFRFLNRDKAWNDCYPLLKDTAKEKGWVLSSKDRLERYFFEGYRRGIEARKEKER